MNEFNNAKIRFLLKRSVLQKHMLKKNVSLIRGTHSIFFKAPRSFSCVRACIASVASQIMIIIIRPNTNILIWKSREKAFEYATVHIWRWYGKWFADTEKNGATVRNKVDRHVHIKFRFNDLLNIIWNSFAGGLLWWYFHGSKFSLCKRNIMELLIYMWTWWLENQLFEEHGNKICYFSISISTSSFIFSRYFHGV